ncbi:MAG TPA: DNA polymerase/3'-5' exonuclease PolX [Enhygromyxa sp.]|nr:DNA polymerase/3'-5' exonuclease PolX [Enhygromyxa sp.]
MTRAPVSNAAVAKALHEMALFLEMQEVPFKPRAYEKAAQVIGGLDRPLAELYAEGGVAALDALPSIGKGIAERIAGMLDTGELADLEALREHTPIDITALTAVGGIGPKRAQALYQALGVRTVAELEQAAARGKIRELPGFGERSEAKIREAVRLYQESIGRRPLARVLDLAESIEATLARIPGVEQVAVAGSIRRRRETVGDIDVVVAAKRAAGARASQAFERMPAVARVIASGPSKTMVSLDNGLDADLRVVAPNSFGAALLYFTGSKAHNIALRKMALSRGWKLNEYGLFEGERSIAGRTELDIYEALGLPWIPPELREDQGEIETALTGELPELIEIEDIRGDLHTHTSWTDGRLSIRELARAAQAAGLEYIAITDHTHSLAVANGLDEERLRAQLGEVRRVDGELDGIRLLTGAEVDILPDGRLDLPDELLAELDVVGVAIHAHFDQDRKTMTRRLLRAIEHPATTMLCHPTARALGRRPPIDFDFDAVLDACARTRTILEIDSQPDRLDLPDALVRRAIAAGVRIAIDSDAHTADELGYLGRFGIEVARRGWATAADVVNTQRADRLLAELRRIRQSKKTS